MKYFKLQKNIAAAQREHLALQNMEFLYRYFFIIY
jgi:hypothetical protein